MGSLSVCEACHRHVKVAEPSCPFCRSPRSRVDLTAALVIGVGLSLAACGASRPVSPNPAPAYGPPPPNGPEVTPSPAPDPHPGETPPPTDNGGQMPVPAYAPPPPEHK